MILPVAWDSLFGCFFNEDDELALCCERRRFVEVSVFPVAVVIPRAWSW